MTNEQFQAFLDLNGAGQVRMPAEQRTEAEQFVASDPAARAAFVAAQRLDHALARYGKTPGADEAAIARVLARFASLPRQKAPVWRLPGVLLDWQFKLAWPRVAALACCAALGFVIGIAGVDRRFDGGATPFAVASGTDIGSIVFEPEALTGARP